MPQAPIQPEKIEGTVQAIVFHNEENGYSIFQARTVSGVLVTVLGVLPSVVAGESFAATGNWQHSPKFGPQFKAEHIIPRPPDTPEAIEQFLSSGLIEGIGKLYAKRIVEKFGRDTFHIIEHESQKLETVEGVGKKRRFQIKESWNQTRAVRDIMFFLHGHGLSTARANRLFQKYGNDAVTILRQNPYQLIRDIPGVGFKTADGIARSMGLADNAPRRIAAGLHHTLEVAGEKGHCLLPREELVRLAAKTLQAELPLTENVLNELITNGELLAEQFDNIPFVMNLASARAEKTVAAMVKHLARLPATYPEMDPDEAVRWFEKTHGVNLGQEQAVAVKQALKSRLLIITGGPGVGKTTILNAILQILANRKVAVLSAPTGRAAKRLSESTGREASTIHRLLEFQPGGGFVRGKNHRLEGGLFVVDEVSMIDIKLMADFLEALPDEGHLILVGDVDQLPSVGPGAVLRDLIESGIVPVARLTEIFRQVGTSRIISAAHAINEGQVPVFENDPGTDCFFIERSSSESIVTTLMELVTRRIPEKFGFDPRDDIQVLTPMNRNQLGTRSLNQQLREGINPPGPLKPEIERFGSVFRLGDKVIQTKNNYDLEVFNGDIGHIMEIRTEPVKMVVLFDAHRIVSYEVGELDELQLAYAITIHKSQGSEFPAVVIPLAMEQYILLQRNLIYTGLTRGKKLVILVGEKKALHFAIQNQASSQRWTGLCQRLSDGKEEARPE